MVIVGERINSSRSAIGRAIENRDSSLIKKEAMNQRKAGAHMLDVNCALKSKNEADDMAWLVSLVQHETNLPLSIDSPNPEVIEAGLSNHTGKAIINSVTLEGERVKAVMPIAKKYDAFLIILLMNEKGMPKSADERLDMARTAKQLSRDYAIPAENIYIDPLIRPISSEPEQAREVIKSVRMIKKELNLKLICGLSNVSYGLPERSTLNAVYLSMMMSAGLDAAILDPTNKKIKSIIKVANALLGKDEYCMEYLRSYRAGEIASL
ncbi:MAG: dihydropteroate synthase [Candidatus Omnitrophica bacterium]|nr:dihydropteroate synthase [Candidatus Omnitrophota bacterium]